MKSLLNIDASSFVLLAACDVLRDEFDDEDASSFVFVIDILMDDEFDDTTVTSPENGDDGLQAKLALGAAGEEPKAEVSDL